MWLEEVIRKIPLTASVQFNWKLARWYQVVTEWTMNFQPVAVAMENVSFRSFPCQDGKAPTKMEGQHQPSQFGPHSRLETNPAPAYLTHVANNKSTLEISSLVSPTWFYRLFEFGVSICQYLFVSVVVIVLLFPLQLLRVFLFSFLHRLRHQTC